MPETDNGDKQPSFRFRYRLAVCSKHGPPSPTRRHVLLVLSLHMDKDGGSCFPSERLLAEETGLSERSVGQHLEVAAREGWVCRQQRGSTKGWRQWHYLASIPDAPEPDSDAMAVAPETGSPAMEFAPEPDALAPEPDDNLHPKEVRTSKSASKSKSTPLKTRGARHSYSDEFEIAWKALPDRAGGKGDKRQAFKNWNARLNEGHTPKQITDGAERYRRYCDVEQQTGTRYVKQGSTFFGPADPPHFLNDWKTTKRGISDERFDDKEYDEHW